MRRRSPRRAGEHSRGAGRVPLHAPRRAGARGPGARPAQAAGRAMPAVVQPHEGHAGLRHRSARRLPRGDRRGRSARAPRHERPLRALFRPREGGSGEPAGALPRGGVLRATGGVRGVRRAALGTREQPGSSHRREAELCSAAGGTRTHTPSRAMDFESIESANSSTAAWKESRACLRTLRGSESGHYRRRIAVHDARRSHRLRLRSCPAPCSVLTALGHRAGFETGSKAGRASTGRPTSRRRGSGRPLPV